jgi:hypothetical protein
MWNYMELWDFKINLICAMVKIHGIYACGSTVIIPGMVGMSSPLSIWMAFMGLNFCSIPYIYIYHTYTIHIYIHTIKDMVPRCAKYNLVGSFTARR